MLLLRSNLRSNHSKKTIYIIYVRFQDVSHFCDKCDCSNLITNTIASSWIQTTSYFPVQVSSDILTQLRAQSTLMADWEFLSYWLRMRWEYSISWHIWSKFFQQVMRSVKHSMEWYMIIAVFVYNNSKRMIYWQVV